MADINIRLSPRLKQWLKARADEEGIKTSALVRRWLLERAEREERKRPTSAPALARKRYGQDTQMERPQ